MLMARSVSFAGVEIHPDGSVRHGGEWQSTSSVRASVETVGQIRERSTLTRVGAGATLGGPIGAVLGALLRKKVDDREVYLAIDGDQYGWMVQVRPAQSGAARQFAAAVNNAAREWAKKDAR